MNKWRVTILNQICMLHYDLVTLKVSVAKRTNFQKGMKFLVSFCAVLCIKTV